MICLPAPRLYRLLRWAGLESPPRSGHCDHDRLRQCAAAPPGPSGSRESPEGLIVATIYYFDRSVEENFLTFFEDTLKPALIESGAAILAYFVSENSPNTFPALPVREDEDIFVWFASFQDEAAYEQPLY